MLQNIRDNAQSKIAKGIVALMIIPFVFFGIDSFFSGGGDKNVAEVDGTEITERELLFAIDTQKRRLQAQMGEAYDPTVITDAMLKPQALESLVQRQLYKSTAANLGIVASDAMLDQEIVNAEEFQEDGQFSRERYELLLRSNGMFPAGHREQLRTQITASQLISGIAQSDFATPADIAVTAKVTDERRDIRYFTLPAVAADSIPSPDEEEIQQFYTDNQQRYMRPDQVQLDYLELKLSDFFTDPDEDEVQAMYQRELQAFEPEVEQKIAHILVNVDDARSREEADKRVAEIQSKLDSGADFAELASEYSDDSGSAESGGELGYITAGVFPEFDPVLKTMNNGDVSAAVETESGLHLLKVLEQKASEYPGFDMSRERIVQELRSATAMPDYVAAIELLEEVTFGADDLDLAAEELELKVQTSEAFSRAGGEGIAAFPAVRTLAFSDEFLAELQNSEAIELGEDRVVVVRLNNFQQAEPQPVAEVKEAISAELHATKRSEASTAAAEKALQLAKNSESMEQAAKQLGLEWQVQLAADRNTLSVDRAILDAAFANEDFDGGKGYLVAALANGDRAVLEISNVQAGSSGRIPAADRSVLMQSLAQMSGNRSFDDFFKSVREQADVVIP